MLGRDMANYEKNEEGSRMNKRICRPVYAVDLEYARHLGIDPREPSPCDGVLRIIKRDKAWVTFQCDKCGRNTTSAQMVPSASIRSEEEWQRRIKQVNTTIEGGRQMADRSNEERELVKVTHSGQSSFLLGAIVPRWQFDDACKYLASENRGVPIGETLRPKQ